MPIIMKALKSFGAQGAAEGKVRRGREFVVASINRAKDLEAHGLAYRIEDTRAPKSTPTVTTVDPEEAVESENEAAEKGPFASAGGETGDRPPADQDPVGPAPSSPPVHQPRPRRLKRSRDASRS